MVIYKITNKINGKSYIGQTIRTIKERWNEHCKSTSDCSAIANAIRKQGKENFIVNIIFTAYSIEELNKAESELISSFNTMSPNGYNLSTGGMNFIRSEETKKKMSQHQIGEGNHRFGTKASVETRIKKSKAVSGDKNPFFGRTHKEDTRKILSDINKNRTVQPRLGMKHSKKSRQKMSMSHKGHMPVNCMAVRCNETGLVYQSVSQAAKSLSIDNSDICKHLKGKRKSCKGYTFSRVANSINPTA